MLFFKKAEPIVIRGAADFARIPTGFFICEAGDKRTLGHRSVMGLTWQVPRPPEMTDKEFALLPVVRLRIASSQNGIAHFGGHSLLDTSSSDSFDGEFQWD
jgi:hypothetical protein